MRLAVGWGGGSPETGDSPEVVGGSDLGPALWGSQVGQG